MKHIQPVSKAHIALAQDENGGIREGLLGLLELLNPIASLNFIVAILGATNDFLVRKAGVAE